MTLPKVEADADSIQVTWTKPEGQVTGYHLTCTQKTTGDGDESRLITLDSGDATQATFDQLKNGEYAVQITAVYGERKSEAVLVTAKTSE